MCLWTISTISVDNTRPKVVKLAKAIFKENILKIYKKNTPSSLGLVGPARVSQIQVSLFGGWLHGEKASRFFTVLNGSFFFIRINPKVQCIPYGEIKNTAKSLLRFFFKFDAF